MDQSKLEMQLQVWKDLAVNKQMMMSAAAEALGLDSDCSVDELKLALDTAIERGKSADDRIRAAQEKADTAVAEMKEKLEASERARTATENQIAAAREAQEKAEHQAAAGREANAKELNRLKDQLAEKEKSLKAIKVALADTPENVVKKLKTLKKQKTDESTERKRAETELRQLGKEKQSLEQQIAEYEAAVENAGKLATQYRELHKLCSEQNERLVESGVEDKNLPEIPELDEALLESLEQLGKKDDNLASAA